MTNNRTNSFCLECILLVKLIVRNKQAERCTLQKGLTHKIYMLVGAFGCQINIYCKQYKAAEKIRKLQTLANFGILIASKQIQRGTRFFN